MLPRTVGAGQDAVVAAAAAVECREGSDDGDSAGPGEGQSAAVEAESVAEAAVDDDDVAVVTVAEGGVDADVGNHRGEEAEPGLDDVGHASPAGSGRWGPPPVAISSDDGCKNKDSNFYFFIVYA